MDHPRGTVAFNYLLMGGEKGSPENFRYILGRQEGDFHMPRHRHAFEQIRLPLIGDMNLGEQGILHEGEIGYFPEGGTYGPQDDPLTEPKQLQLVLQFGGSSGLGMGAGRGGGPDNKEAQARPRARGPQRLPRARYANTVKFDPARFTYRSVDGQPGVETKFFGSFTERRFWIERIRIDAGATWVSDEATARRLIVVLAGAGTAEGVKIGKLAAIQAEGGEKLTVTATETLELHVVAIPPVPRPVEQEEYDVVESDAPIEFEKPKATV
ncbi:hypothetical protein [Nocardia jiangxiensis]|uniref:Pirin C-terminal domain-containing protein n=1 Tax=Nocardia jiangxiensis TaxID=282685 RepID=A0ABW6SCC6_9NOCA|nr:hypothetical protein [Nocardia jiangxiensis]